jgi:hypothetical protein
MTPRYAMIAMRSCIHIHALGDLLPEGAGHKPGIRRQTPNRSVMVSIMHPRTWSLMICASLGAGLMVLVPSIAAGNTRRCNVVQAGSNNLPGALPSGIDLRSDPSNGTVIFLRANNLSRIVEKDPGFRKLQSSNQIEQVALAFLTAYATVFKLEHPPDELTVKSALRDDLGAGNVRFQQVFLGIPLWACEIMVHLDKLNHVTLVQGRYVPTPVHFSVTPQLSATEALQVVAEVLKNKALGGECRGCRVERVIFVDSQRTPRLAYRVLANISLAEGWIFMIDAQEGAVLEKLPAVHDGGLQLR